MAYAPRYIFQFVSDNGKTISVRINEDGYTGTVTKRNVGGAPTLRLEKNDCIRGMSLEIPAECIVEDEFADLYTSNPYKFKVEVASNDVVVWHGFITPELYSAPWIDPPYDVTLTATDGLGELKMHTYPALGRQSLEALLLTLLGATGLSLPIRFISTMANDTIESTYLLADTTVNLDAYAGKTYYEVLQKLLTCLHATIQQRGGAWLLIRETDINNMTSDDAVSDTAGSTYPITDFGSMQSNDVWPVGQLRMEIVPAKNRVNVSAANDFTKSILADPEMIEGDWQGDGTHYTSDGGFYALEKSQMLYQDYIPEISDVNSYPDFFDWKFKFRQSGNREATFGYGILAAGIEKGTNQPIQLSWIRSEDGKDGYWAVGRFWMTANVDRARYGNSADCAELTTAIRMFGGLSNSLSRLDSIQFYFVSRANTIYIHESSVAVSSLIEGVNTVLIMDNNARGAADTVEPAVADTYNGNHGLSFMWNAAYGKRGYNNYLIEAWRSAIIPALPYGEFLAKDNALSVANPRLRLQGKLNVVDHLPSLFYRTKEIAFLAEEWSFDLLHDEADISIISLPASAIQVVSVRQMAFNEEGETDLSVSVLPSSFNLEAGDSTTRCYIAINAPADLAWTVTGVPDWIVMSEDDKSGTGSDTISFLGTVNSGPVRQAIIIVAGIPVSIYQGGIGEDYPLTINYTPSDANLALTVDGEPVEYREGGIPVASGSAVVVTLTKTGYGTIVDTFTMPSQITNKNYTMVTSIEATVSYNGNISSAAQRVTFTISDPSRHGWSFSWGWLASYHYLTGYGKISGTTSLLNGDGAMGVGDAVLYIDLTANSSTDARTLSDWTMYFDDSVTGSKTYITITQQGTGGQTVNVTSISLNKSSLALGVGDSDTLTATVLPANATNKTLSWSTSNSSVATVSQNGVVTGLGAGTCTIWAYATDGSGKYASCNVTVTGANIPVTGVTLNKPSLFVGVGGTATLIPTILPPGASNQNVTWDSSDDLVATVNSSGVVTGIREGSCVVTVTTVDGGYTATCNVTVTADGSMSVDNVTLKGSADSASTKLTDSNMNLSTITASWPSSASWIRSVAIDTSGSEHRVRISTTQNLNTSPSRSATVTLTGSDRGGTTRTATFTVTQTVKSVNDVPCTAINIFGESTLQNSGNSSEYTASYRPDGCTMTSCTWSIVSGSNYATIEPSGNQCVVKAKPGANGNIVTIKATNAYNSVSATKSIEVTYVAPSNISVNPASVRLAAQVTTDNSPVITATGIETGSLRVKAVSGFITSADIMNGKVVAYFSENTSSESRNGSVTLAAMDANTLQEVTAVVGYVQVGQTTSSNTFHINKLSLNQVGGKVNALFEVNFYNTHPADYTFYGLYFTLKGYDANDNETFSKEGTLGDKTVAAITTETEVYDKKWTATLGMSVRYVLTIMCDSRSDIYEGDGTDII